MTRDVRLGPDAAGDDVRGGRLQPPETGGGRLSAPADGDTGLQPWQLFLLAALACATVGMFLTQARGVSGVLLLTTLIGAAALVGLAGLLAVRPLVSEADDRTRVVGQRTRDALEREKTLALRALKELEFDRAMGKLSDADYQDMSSRLRARATRLLRQLDTGEGYRARIEQEVAQRLREAGETGDVRLTPDATDAGSTPPSATTAGATKAHAARACAACATSNDADARFCKECGAKL